MPLTALKPEVHPVIEDPVLPSTQRILEAAALLVLAPVAWFPWQLPLLTLAVLPLIPAALVVRLRTTGRLVARTELEAPLTLLLVATCIASAVAVDVRLALPKLLGIALGASIVVCIVNWVDSIPAAKRTGNLLIGLTIVLLGVGVAATEWTTGKLVALNSTLEHLPTLLRGAVPDTARGAVNPNELAGVLALLIPVMVAQLDLRAFVLRERRVRSLAAALAAAGGSALLITTASRGAIVATSMALTAWCAVVVARGWRDPRTERAARLARGGSLTGLVLVEVWAAVELFRRAPVTAEGSSSAADTLQGRVEVWQRGLEMVRDFSITGIGPGQFDRVLHLLYTSPVFGPGQLVPHAHNLLLAYAVELGVPGLVAFCLVLIAAFRCCWIGAHSHDAYVRRTSIGLGLGLAAFLGFGLTDAIAPGARGGVVLWAILGFAAALGRLTPGEALNANDHR